MFSPHNPVIVGNLHIHTRQTKKIPLVCPVGQTGSFTQAVDRFHQCLSVNQRASLSQEKVEGKWKVGRGEEGRSVVLMVWDDRRRTIPCVPSPMWSPSKEPTKCELASMKERRFSSSVDVVHEQQLDQTLHADVDQGRPFGLSAPDCFLSLSFEGYGPSSDVFARS